MRAPFGRDEIEAIIPHRDPFLFLDEVLELEPGRRVVARKQVRADEWFFRGHFPDRPIMPGVIMVEALAQAGAVAALSVDENRGKLALFAGTDGARISITGVGCHVPERVLTNDELAELVDTSDEWIVTRTGIRERRIVAPEEALTDIALPAARAALADAGVEANDIDFLVCATVTPDMMFPTSSALLADMLGAPEAAAYDLLAGCTGFVYALAQAYAMVAAGLADKALVVGGDVLSKILDWSDRSTLVLFGDGAGAVVLERVERGGFLGVELGADGGGGIHLSLPGSGSRVEAE